MSPEARRHWPGPRWTLAVLLAGLGALGPFSIDTYLPAFAGIADALGATPLQMQQTLSGYIFGFAFMNLFHGALSDSFGRRPVVLVGVAVFTLASVGCALSTSIGALVGFRVVQGLSAGAGIVVSRAVIRDLFAPEDAQRMMSQVTLFFGAAPALAPIVGGALYVTADWHSIFWFLAAVGLLLWIANWRWLPETLNADHVQPFSPGHLLRGYLQLGASARFLLLAIASGVPFNGMFLYVLCAPAFLGEHLGLAPTQFFWFFIITVSGIMAGAWVSGRLAGRVAPRAQIRWGFATMTVVALCNVAANLLFTPSAAWALVPPGLVAFGWSLNVAVITLLALEIVPERRGMAASLQAFIGSSANGLVAGVVAPLVMHSPLLTSIAAALMTAIGLAAWMVLKRRWPAACVPPVHHPH